MDKYSAVILEDDLSFALTVEMLLEKMGIGLVDTLTSTDQLSGLFKTNQIDLILSDIELANGEMAFNFFRDFDRGAIPLIYFTAYEDEETYQQALLTRPAGIVIKPFNELTLRNTIENALGLNLRKVEYQLEAQSIFVKQKNQYIRLQFDELIWVEADGNYCLLHTETGKFMIRISLKRLSTRITDSRFLRVHRKFLINSGYITAYDKVNQTCTVHGNDLPIGRHYRKSVKAYLTKSLE